MKPTEKVLFGDCHDWFRLEAERVEPGGMSSERTMKKR